ncbi:MAG: phosphoglycerate kinase [Deltaproteobacteria bacterium]|nr:phosphoglycerate kinase [Deltaproteobacteria bacterium]
MRSIRDLNLEGKAVFMRLDLNVPMKDGKVTSDARINAALPTIKFALDKGARLAITSHLGRPKGKRDMKYSLEPVGARLSEILGKDVLFAEDCIGDGVKGMVKNLRPGGIILLENVRFHEGETKNDPEFAKALAAPFEVFVNDAFGSSHREHASVTGIVKYVQASGGGFLLEKEVQSISKLVNNPQKPFVAILGGAKVADKIGVLGSLVGKADTLLIGGAMAYTFLKAQGVDVGGSKFEEDQVRHSQELLKRAKDRGVDILLPIDHSCADTFSEDATLIAVTTQNIPAGKLALDIGPQTRKLYSERIAQAATVFWNGPMGVFEWSQFAAGTNALAQAVANSEAFTVVGGGDSVSAIEKAGIQDKIDHVSTGGGASLEFIENGSLPGIVVLS